MRVRPKAFAFLIAIAVLVALGVPTISGAGVLNRATGQLKTLKAPAPAWYTPALHQKVLAAGTRGVALPATKDVPASSLVFLGIRPGQLILLTEGDTTSLCTSNFVFTNAAGNYFIGTAGHCGHVGAQVTMLFLPMGLVDIGNIVYSTGDAGVGNDFALISIDPALNQYVSPSLAYWGGPTGVYTGGAGTVVEHAGWGLVVGTGGTPRAGLSTEHTSTLWSFLGVIYSGDSGSGAVALGGQAVGNITHMQAISGLIPTGTNYGTSMTRILQLIGSGYTLATCSALPWPLPGCP